MKIRKLLLPIILRSTLLLLSVVSLVTILSFLVSVSSAEGEQVAEDSYVYLPIIVDFSDLLLSDNFSNPNSGWPVDDDGVVKWSYQEGEYEMLSRFSDVWAGALGPVYGLTDYNVRASMRRLQGSTSDVGLVFDWKNWDNFYYLVVDPGGQWFGVAKVIDGTPNIVIGQTFAQGDIFPGNATNRLRVDRNGPEIGVSINGKRVATAVDRQFPPPYRAGFYMESDDDAPAINRYDDVEIWRADSAQVQKVELSSFEAPFASGAGFDFALDWDAGD